MAAVNAGGNIPKPGGSGRRAFMPSSALSNPMADDPDSPQNWSIAKKAFNSFRVWLFAMTVALGISCFTAGKVPFSEQFGLSSTLPLEFIAAFSLYIFGIAFAPYWTPHLVERVGRSIPFYVFLTLNALFNLGAAKSNSLSGVMACRFVAGFFGGPTLVSIEGFFAELWSSEKTNSYYAVQGTAGFVGAGLGPLIGGFLVENTGGWRWTQYFPACLAAGVLVFGLFLPETYNREIARRQAKKQGRSRSDVTSTEEPAQSGATFGEAFNVTVIQPAKLFFTQPIVTLTSAIMFFTWATTFQWFISVPAALEPPPPLGPGFPIQRVGLAYLTAILGGIVAAITVIVIDAITLPLTRNKEQAETVEYRVIPAMLGTLLMTAGLFWVGNTIKPSVKPIVPIVGTAFFVWGSASVTFSIIPYTFDLFEPAPTLGAITSQAVGRILAAGFLPFLILQDITALGPKWGLGTLGFISLAFIPIPWILFFFGTNWRRRSKYSMMP